MAEIDQDYLLDILRRLLMTPSPTGMTEAASRLVCHELESLGIPFELTRRGAIRANLEGGRHSPDRAVVTHLDTLGAMVRELKDNGRLGVAPIGSWSARFAEGARVTVFGSGGRDYRGQILPLKASGHVWNEEVDSQPVGWSHVEVRLDEVIWGHEDLMGLGIHVGDHVAVDPQPEVLHNGFICSRHLDDKAGVATVLAAAKYLRDHDCALPIDCHLLFTISEEVGVGASHVLHGDVAEMVAVDNGTIAPAQNTHPFGVTIAMMDSSGPFDWYLTRELIEICTEHRIPYSRDVFRHYRSDGAAAVEAGNDIRTALVCFGLDASHGYERTHIDSLTAIARLLVQYIQRPPLFARDERVLGPMRDFPRGGS